MARVQYPYTEGDLYWTLEVDKHGKLCAVQSVWDDQSEDMFDTEGNETYFDELSDIERYVTVTGTSDTIHVYPCTGSILPWVLKIL